MNLYECQEKAKDIGFDKAVFDAHFPVGAVKCKWLDAYFGMFMADLPGLSDGFLMVRQINDMFPNLVCENLRVEE